jgi:enoyl-CoA hydratase/carnithine racemase
VDRVTVSLIDGVADVQLNRPDKRNALDPAMFEALVATGERLKTESGLRVVVLSGNGPDFCAGLDFASFEAMRAGDRTPAPAQLPPPDGPAKATGQRAAYVKIRALVGSPNQAEAVTARFERRNPVFADV